MITAVLYTQIFVFSQTVVAPYMFAQSAESAVGFGGLAILLLIMTSDKMVQLR